MKKMVKRTSTAVAAVVGGVLAMGCTETVTGPRSPEGAGVKVNIFATLDGPAALRASHGSGASAAGPVQSIDITRVALVFGGFKLETAGVDATVDWVLEVSQVVDVAVDAPTLAAASFTVPPGTYKEVEVSIDKLEEGNPAEEPLIAANPGLANASLLVEGTVQRPDGSTGPFSFATDVDADLEAELTPFFTVPENDAQAVSTVIAVVIDLDRWFRDSQNTWLDPTDAGDRSPIEASFSGSFDAFVDLDENGAPDG